MARSPPTPGAPPAPGAAGASPSPVAQRLRDDVVLRVAFLTVGLLLAYQLAATLLGPGGLALGRGELLVLVAWLVLLVAELVRRWFTRLQPAHALAWWLMGAGLLCNAVASSLWLVEVQVLFPNHVPFPAGSDL